MISYNIDSYGVMFGNISHEAINNSTTCISQCTGCMCNCRCSCSGGVISEFEWEEV